MASPYFIYLCLSFARIIIKTAVRIVIIPVMILGVSCSWNTMTPKNRAVTGSNAPSTAAGVEPISFIEIVIASSDTIVGRIESAIALSHNTGVCMNCNSVQNFRLITYTRSPNNIT